MYLVEEEKVYKKRGKLKMGIVKKLFGVKPKCHHFNKEFKAHTKWVGERASYYGDQPETRDLYFECVDCGEIFTREQNKDFNNTILNYNHITMEDMPY